MENISESADESTKWFVYMIRCKDNSIYTGITTDVDRRFEEHKNGSGAKYTRSHKPVSVEAYFESESRSEASKLEYEIKQKTRQEKEEMIKSFRRLKGL